MINILDYGAVGDGKTDNTAAIQQALDAAGELRCSVLIPEGRYRTSRLRVPSYCGIVGHPSWGFRDVGGSVLELNDAQASCLLDVSDTSGVNLDGLSLEGHRGGDGVHGIALDQEDYGANGAENSLTIERCRVNGFSGNGVYLHRAWCFSIRHCMISHCGGDGVWLRGWDGFIMDNWLTGNERAGFGAYEENASVTFTANRLEWNFTAGIEIHGGDHYNITGNFFDRHGGPAIELMDRSGVPASQITVTGNILYRNGKPQRCGDQPYDSSHIRCMNAEGVVISSNVCEVSEDDPKSTESDGNSPEWGIVIGGLNDVIIKDNILHKGFKDQLMVDLGGHKGTVIIKDNIGSAFVESPVSATAVL
ncbi:right-handed parallel beta-helix repeat-containing protein [Coraliomargarita algicola]|uniref:Right-handed parallel beta-helix repeat-containing protein n=1 Tax=Coraliomargarita algicola TaxID=3092156 RepID=A0ABZ0RGE5_9BACT|nr:right-handed parallel beta-helix repeat-containing protein [Coraliomargarita sp. J2-16]WPJ95171.1 right-handed parallel beta-helix repeat-containing protein [Coraliomargarita sp. J2-16]